MVKFFKIKFLKVYKRQVAETTNALLDGKLENIIALGIFSLIIIFIFIILVKLGLLKVNGKILKVENGEITREIIRRQIEYATNSVQEFVALMPKDENFDEYRAKYAAEKALDRIVIWICVNHIRDDNFYIENGQMEIWNILQGIGQKPEYITKEFREKCNKYVETTVKRLVAIREYYTK